MPIQEATAEEIEAGTLMGSLTSQFDNLDGLIESFVVRRVTNQQYVARLHWVGEDEPQFLEVNTLPAE